MNENQIYSVLRESMADVRMHRPVEQIVAAGRGHRRRRRQLLAAAAVSGLAACTAVALSLPGAGSPAAPPAALPGTTPVHLELTGFTLDRKADGTIDLVLSRTKLADPQTLQSALAKVGVRAKVTAGKACVDPENPGGGAGAVISDVHPASAAYTAQVWVISPARIPSGSTLHVGLFPARSAVAGAVISFAVIPDSVTPTCAPPRKHG